MELLVPIFCLLLLVGLIFYVGYPLVGATALYGLQEGEHQRLVERREQLLAAIKEIEFDQAMGVLHQLDQLKGAARQSRGGSLTARVEKDILALRQKDRAHCSSCGAQRQPADRFCSRCGNRFAEAEVA